MSSVRTTAIDQLDGGLVVEEDMLPELVHSPRHEKGMCDLTVGPRISEPGLHSELGRISAVEQLSALRIVGSGLARVGLDCGGPWIPLERISRSGF